MVSTVDFADGMKAVESSSLEELALSYQETQDSIIFRVAEKKLRGLTRMMGSRFYPVDNCDLESLSMYALHKALMAYKVNSGGTLLTLYSVVLSRDLQKLVSRAKKLKRSGNVVILPDHFAVFVNNISFSYEETAHNQSLMFDLIERSTELNEQEKLYCTIVLKTDLIRDMDIAAIMGVKKHNLYHLKKMLRKKFTALGWC